MAEYDILRKGFVRPYIIFQFEDGTTLDTTPPRYFQSFEQTRTCDKACEFKLTLTYVPNYDGRKDANLMQALLLNKVNTRVTYQYGYLVADSPVPILQNQKYSGILLQYEESINETTLSYTLSGTSSVTGLNTRTISIQNFIEKAKMLYQGEKVKPSELVSLLCGESYNQDISLSASDYAILNAHSSSTIEHLYYANSPKALISEAIKTGIVDLLRGYKKDIDNIDDEIFLDDMKVSDGTVHDIFCGKSNIDGSASPDCFVYYSQIDGDDKGADTLLQTLSSSLSADDVRLLESARIVNRFSSTTYNEIMSKTSTDVQTKAKGIRRYIAYFDNVIEDGYENGTFHYKAVGTNNQTTNDMFNFDFGNSFIESVVLSFNTNYNCAVAYASIAGLDDESVNIDVDGEPIGGNYAVSQTGNLKKNSYPTLSGFRSDTLISESLIAQALQFPYEATMQIIGETMCHHLLDTIHVNVFVNGVPHSGMTGNYIIKGISDSLSDSGFTTTFNLQRDAFSAPGTLPDKVSTAADSRAGQNDVALRNSNS